MMKIVFATQNLGKLKEVSELWKDLPVEILGLDEWPEIGDIVEDGDTFAENSLIKARAVAEHTGLASMADDSGLCIDALNGWPGVKSARIAFTDRERCIKALEQMIPHPSLEQRSASFICVATLWLPQSGKAFSSEGRTSGRIERDIMLGGGFGYDPIFHSFDLDKRFSEVSAEEKNSVSHRGRAFRQLADDLRESGLI